MKVPRSTKPNQKRRYFIRMLLAALMTTTMIATGGFGIFSDNPLTEAFKEVIGENFPVDFLNQFNTYMANLSAPQIPPAADSGADKLSPPDPVGAILSLFEKNTGADSNNKTPFPIEETLIALASTQTKVVLLQNSNFTMTQAQIQTQTAFPTITLTLQPTITQTTIPTRTPLPVYYYPPTATKKPEPILPPTFTFTPTNTPTPIPNHLILYKGAVTTGGFGPRSSADALCTAGLPAGFSNYRAFVGFSASDSIASMATNYGMPTNLPIQSTTNVVIANDWSDLMDGNIDVALSAAGVLSPGDWWWSGSEDGFGNHINGTTASCMGWTSNSGSDPGIAGYHGDPNSPWLRDTIAGCGDPLPVLCIAY